MTDYKINDENYEYVQNVQNFLKPRSSEYKPKLAFRTVRHSEILDNRKCDFGHSDKLPISMRHVGVRAMNFLKSLIKGTYRFACNFSWIVFSTAIILFSPLVIEYERNNDQDKKRRPLMLGPGMAVTN